MSDIVLLIEAATGATQWIMVVVFAVATGLLAFDRAGQSHRAKGKTLGEPRDRMAA